jgi:hypothetical protein
MQGKFIELPLSRARQDQLSLCRISTFFSILFVVTMISTVARGTPINATLTGLNPYIFGKLSLDGVEIPLNGNGGVGQLQWSGNASNSSPFKGTFYTYCIDLLEDIGFWGNYNFDITPLELAPKASAYPGGMPSTGMGSVKADEIAELYGLDYASTLDRSSGVQREAFQLAIWNLVYDTDFTVDSGNFHAVAGSGLDPAAIQTADNYLAGVAAGGNSTHSLTHLAALVGENGAQDQIFYSDQEINVSGNSTIVPLPRAALFGGVLLAACMIGRSRRGRTVHF